jgi:LysM domain
MGSLTAHLLETGDHGRLRFHPSCPVCRQERLYGTLSTEPVVSRRAQALLAGGVLAVSSSAPAVAIAQEPDRQFEGVAAPEELGGPELDDPSFDPGGDTALPFDTAPAPAAPDGSDDSGDGAPLDVEPTVDLDAQVDPLAEDVAPVTETAPPADEESAVPPAESVAPVGPEAPPSAPPTPPAEPPAQLDEQVGGPSTDTPTNRGRARSDAGVPGSPHRGSDGAGAPSEDHRGVARAAPSPLTAPPPAASPPAPPAPPPPLAPPAPPASPTPAAEPVAAEPIAVAEPVAVAEADVAAPTGSREPLTRDARFYVVQPGDSLWSIAKRLLGGDASAGRVAREVNRLWSLNRSRIATGNPDLLMVGTRLELR